MKGASSAPLSTEPHCLPLPLQPGLCLPTPQDKEEAFPLTRQKGLGHARSLDCLSPLPAAMAPDPSGSAPTAHCSDIGSHPEESEAEDGEGG